MNPKSSDCYRITYFNIKQSLDSNYKDKEMFKIIFTI